MSEATLFGGLVSDFRLVKQHLLANPAIWLMCAGLAVMFAPTLYDLYFVNELWLDDQHSHGPIILAIALWLLWKRWHEAPDLSSLQPSPALAWACFIIAGALYVPGRALDIIYFETGAFVWVRFQLIFSAWLLSVQSTSQ